MEMILSGRLYKGQEAMEMGLVNGLAPADRLSKEVEKVLGTLFRNPQYTLTQAKRAVYASQNNVFTEGLQEESKAFSTCFSQNYFVDLMIKQIQEGSLTTTAKLPDWVRKKKGG